MPHMKAMCRPGSRLPSREELMSATTPPRLLGGLMMMLGLVLVGGGVQLGATDMATGGAYFLVVGVLVLVSGALIVAGRKAAVPVYGVTLAVVWTWSLKDTGGEF